ncbi:MAG: hypothetical protein VB035_05530 [Candidatus Fimivivens sp.]|nr:hypothetical protein [Candidatus Fimivivens sp.]
MEIGKANTTAWGLSGVPMQTLPQQSCRPYKTAAPATRQVGGVQRGNTLWRQSRLSACR